ncbi:proteasome accessory factor A [Brevibacterium sanguinis]|uniref:Pup--protein ligase n=2 Tax=Brevibacterium TaxID=1696 RepID=A0A366ILM6_9MICO|nr:MULTISPECIES: Pup--protein ligase [Brevibacterium]RBP64699.1 proteasome accessory factor A [Brevibacterium sanguinis]RBP71658.1 proteasome accessory factor A [Brevibacterium celere]
MARIYGLETEYGLAHSPGPEQRRIGPEEIARHLFRPIVEWGRSSNVFLPNGSRLYLDVGSHPEYATAECDTLIDLLTQDRAGEALMVDLLAQAQSSIEAEGVGGRIHMVKNNTDAAGNSYGSHENFLIRRNLDFNRLTSVLLPFLVSRQLLVGAGAVIPTKSSFHPDEEVAGDERMFGLSARSDVMWEGLSSATTRSRPIINARDEPHADSEKYRRLHVIVGDSSMSTATSALKIGSAVLILDLIEQGARIPEHGLRHPVRDIRLVARDLTGTVPLERTDSSTITPLRLLADYRDRAQVIVEKGDHSLGDDGLAGYVIDLWTRMLAAVESQDFSAVDREIDWVMKKALIDRALGRGIDDIADPRIHRLDIAYHDITPATGLFPKLEAAGMAECLVDPEAVARAKDRPPQTTRAAIRGEFVRAAHAARRDYTVDWVHLRLNDESGRAVALKNPFESSHQQAQALIAGL